VPPVSGRLSRDFSVAAGMCGWTPTTSRSCYCKLGPSKGTTCRAKMTVSPMLCGVLLPLYISSAVCGVLLPLSISSAAPARRGMASAFRCCTWGLTGRVCRVKQGTVVDGQNLFFISIHIICLIQLLTQ
jgi:hypothetical protein